MDLLHSPFRSRRQAAPRPEPILRPITGFEEEFLEANLHDTDPVLLCNELLARCMGAPGEDTRAALAQVRAMLIPERDRCLVQLRRLSLGDKLELSTRCPHCSHPNGLSLDLAQLPTDFVVEKRRVEVDVGRPAVLRLPTAGDQEQMRQSKGSAERRTVLLSTCLEALGEERGPFSEDRIRALTTGERRAMEEALTHALPDFSLSLAISCAGCSQDFVAPLDLRSFFLPS
ncbi:MAG TPA: hypothetical protein PKY30_06605 [Myxococcota bacterium]|nr:hypothetical protein [Myxococcota bacterium]HNH46689.1 hypothetical protein [Myxococcota bacterium]